MLRTFYKWRNRRREKRPSFSFHTKENNSFGPAFGHYLSQKGSHQVADSPYERKKRLKKVGKFFILLGLLGIGIWLVIELIFAIRFF